MRDILSIIGEYPTSGFRIDLVREMSRQEPPWVYTGRLATPDGEAPLSVTVSSLGEVALECELDAPLAERVRLLVRQVVKHALADEQVPPRRIQRWRP